MRSSARLAALLVAGIAVGFWLPAPARGQAGEAAGMITEIKVGRGRVEVRPVGGQEWRRAGPLLALRAGDTVRATEDASAVVLLSGSRGSVKVSTANSPFTVAAPQPGEGKAQKALSLLESSLGFLSATAKEAPRATLSTRGGTRPPLILTPRNVPVLPGTLAFEWLGSRSARYSVRIVGPGGPVLERTVTGARLDYPADAPALRAGMRYTIEVVSGNHPVQQAWFEVVEAARAQAIRQDLRDLEQAAGPTASPNTHVALRAGLLASRGLLHDARQALVAGLQKDPDEPTFHFLLGKLYDKAGLAEQAAEALDEARFLMSGPAAR